MATHVHTTTCRHRKCSACIQHKTRQMACIAELQTGRRGKIAAGVLDAIGLVVARTVAGGVGAGLGGKCSSKLLINI